MWLRKQIYDLIDARRVEPVGVGDVIVVPTVTGRLHAIHTGNGASTTG
jgi:hypothetical protein